MTQTSRTHIQIFAIGRRLSLSIGTLVVPYERPVHVRTPSVVPSRVLRPVHRRTHEKFEIVQIQIAVPVARIFQNQGHPRKRSSRGRSGEIVRRDVFGNLEVIHGVRPFGRVFAFFDVRGGEAGKFVQQSSNRRVVFRRASCVGNLKNLEGRPAAGETPVSQHHPLFPIHRELSRHQRHGLAERDSRRDFHEALFALRASVVEPAAGRVFDRRARWSLALLKQRGRTRRREFPSVRSRRPGAHDVTGIHSGFGHPFQTRPVFPCPVLPWLLRFRLPTSWALARARGRQLRGQGAELSVYHGFHVSVGYVEYFHATGLQQTFQTVAGRTCESGRDASKKQPQECRMAFRTYFK